MERPPYLREDAYQELVTSVSAQTPDELGETALACGYDVQDGSPNTVLAQIIERPSRYLYCRCNILARQDLLADLFIEFDDEELDAGHAYLIDEEAAAEIAGGEATVLLRSGKDGGVMVPRTRI